MIPILSFKAVMIYARLTRTFSKAAVRTKQAVDKYMGIDRIYRFARRGLVPLLLCVQGKWSLISTSSYIPLLGEVSFVLEFYGLNAVYTLRL